MCCGDSIVFDFQNVINEFEDLSCLGEREWPVLYDEKKKLIMVHSTVGTQSVFKNGQCKVIISGFCTSLKACSEFLYDVTPGENDEKYEIKHTFGGNSGSLRKGLNKILKDIGLYDKFGIKIDESANQEGFAWPPISATLKNPAQFPVLMTQALCCMGTEKKANADKIMSSIQNPSFPSDFRAWVDNSLTSWIDRISNKKSEDSILLLLGYRTGKDVQQSAIHRLLETARYINGSVHTTVPRDGTVLYDHLMRLFNGKIGFVIHPANLNDKNLRIYLSSEMGKKTRKLIEQLELD